MSDLNLKAKEFVPSWLKPPASKAAAPAPTPEAPKSAPQAPPPTKASVKPTAAAAPVASSSAPVTTTARHMNPNAPVFQPASWPAPTAKPATPQLQAATAQLAPVPQLKAVNNLTDEQIRAISQKSNLKVAAAVFVPGQRSNKLALSKPSPLTLTPIVPDTEMLLSDLWCLYALCTSVTKEDTFDPAPVFRIDSVATFWKVMNNLPEPTELPPPSTMYLFRDDINPKWEDPKNCNGGVYKIRVERSKIDIVWLLVACKTIGESWAKEHRNKVNGAVLKVREKSFYIEIWVSEEVPKLSMDVLSAIESEVAFFEIDYHKHEDMQIALKEAAAANAKKQKQNKGKRK